MVWLMEHCSPALKKLLLAAVVLRVPCGHCSKYFETNGQRLRRLKVLEIGLGCNMDYGPVSCEACDECHHVTNVISTLNVRSLVACVSVHLVSVGPCKTQGNVSHSAVRVHCISGSCQLCQ